MVEINEGLEGVVAFETEIAEPDKEGGALRYRGVDIEDLVGQVSVRQRLGPAGRRQVRPGPAAGRAVPDPGALRRHPGRRAVRGRDARAGLGPAASCSTSTTSRPARTSPGPSVMALSFVAQSARGLGLPMVPQKRDRQGRDDRRAVHDPLARRARPAARQGRRRLLHLRRRARHERLDLHRPRRRLHRRRRRGLHLRRDRRAVRPAARRRARPGCCT